MLSYLGRGTFDSFDSNTAQFIRIRDMPDISDAGKLTVYAWAKCTIRPIHDIHWRLSCAQHLISWRSPRGNHLSERVWNRYYNWNTAMLTDRDQILLVATLLFLFSLP